MSSQHRIEVAPQRQSSDLQWEGLCSGLSYPDCTVKSQALSTDTPVQAHRLACHCSCKRKVDRIFKAQCDVAPVLRAVLEGVLQQRWQHQQMQATMDGAAMKTGGMLVAPGLAWVGPPHSLHKIRRQSFCETS